MNHHEDDTVELVSKSVPTDCTQADILKTLWNQNEYRIYPAAVINHVLSNKTLRNLGKSIWLQTQASFEANWAIKIPRCTLAKFFGNDMRVMSRRICLSKAVVEDISFHTPGCHDENNTKHLIDALNRRPANENIFINPTAQQENIRYENKFLFRATQGMGVGHALTISRVYLGKRYPGVYLSRRESECVFMQMLGMSRQEISAYLQISIRTMDFYIQSIKLKLGCQSSRKIISCIQETDFIKIVRNFLPYSLFKKIIS